MLGFVEVLCARLWRTRTARATSYISTMMFRSSSCFACEYALLHHGLLRDLTPEPPPRIVMEDPKKEIEEVFSKLTMAPSATIQASALARYYTSDAGFRHPLCRIPCAPGSRDQLLGIYQYGMQLGLLRGQRTEPEVADGTVSCLPLSRVMFMKSVSCAYATVYPELTRRSIRRPKGSLVSRSSAEVPHLL